MPVNQPTVFARIAASHGANVIWTKVDPYDFGLKCAEEGVVLGCGWHWQLYFPEFQSAMDGLIALAKLLEFLAKQT